MQFAFSLATPLANISLQKSIDDRMNKKLDFILKNKQPDNYIILQKSKVQQQKLKHTLDIFLFPFKVNIWTLFFLYQRDLCVIPVPWLSRLCEIDEWMGKLKGRRLEKLITRNEEADTDISGLNLYFGYFY